MRRQLEQRTIAEAMSSAIQLTRLCFFPAFTDPIDFVAVAISEFSLGFFCTYLSFWAAEL
jgi:hypothetical protein